MMHEVLKCRTTIINTSLKASQPEYGKERRDNDYKNQANNKLSHLHISLHIFN